MPLSVSLIAVVICGLLAFWVLTSPAGCNVAASTSAKTAGADRHNYCRAQHLAQLLEDRQRRVDIARQIVLLRERLRGVAERRAMLRLGQVL